VRSRISVSQKAVTEGFIAPQEVEKIDRLVSAKFSELAETIDLKRQHRDQDAFAIIRGGQGKQLMDEIRDTRGPRPLLRRAPLGRQAVKSGSPLAGESGTEPLFMISRKPTFLAKAIGTIFFGVLCLSGCDKTAAPVSKLTRANFNQIHENMSKEEVRAILGSPSSSSTEDKLIYKRTTWRYVEGDKYINITFKNDGLDSKDTNLGTQ
jgi:CHASE3 domain/SmpA / OmlA family